MSNLDLVANRCKELKVKLILAPGKNVDAGEGIMCSGFFDSTGKVLAVALGSDVWDTTLLHEYNHMLQWAERAKVWTKCLAIEDKAEYTIDDYILGKDAPVAVVDAIFKANMLLELDCEQRTSLLMETLGYSTEFINEYKQKALAYVLSYHQIKKHRKWYHPKKAPYYFKQLFKELPPDLTVDIFSDEWVETSKIFKVCLGKNKNEHASN